MEPWGSFGVSLTWLLEPTWRELRHSEPSKGGWYIIRDLALASEAQPLRYVFQIVK